MSSLQPYADTERAAFTSFFTLAGRVRVVVQKHQSFPYGTAAHRMALLASMLGTWSNGRYNGVNGWMASVGKKLSAPLQMSENSTSRPVVSVVEVALSASCVWFC